MTNPGSEPSPGHTSGAFDWERVHRSLDALREKVSGIDAGPGAASQQVLLERSRHLAQASVPAADVPALDVVSFALGPERYAIEAQFLREAVGVREITPLPGVPDFIAGIFNLRGRIVSVLDLKRVLGLPPVGLSDFHTVLVIGSRQMEMGLLVDSVAGVAHLPLNALQPPLATSASAQQRFIRGITADSLVLLDGTALLHDPGLLVNQQPPSF